MQVRYRQGGCGTGVRNEEHSERETPQNGPTKFMEDERVMLQGHRALPQAERRAGAFTA